MGPTVDAINAKAIQPAQKGKITQEQAFTVARDELKKFMLLQISGKNSREEIGTFYGLAVQQETRAGRKLCRIDQVPSKAKCLVDLEKASDPKAAIAQLPLRVIIPAFLISELKKAFIMGFAVLLPFLVIDLVISNILLSLGMMMLPPVVISLPFKILLFVLAGGWTLVVEFLMKGFNY
jgi:flagellar biosynthesis protein FliP